MTSHKVWKSHYKTCVPQVKRLFKTSFNITVGAWILNIGILNAFGKRKSLKFRFPMVCFRMVSHSNSYGPDHSKTEPLEIQTEMAAIWFWFPRVLDKMATILLKIEHYWNNESNCQTKQRAVIEIQKMFGIPAPNLLKKGISLLINIYCFKLK